MISGILDFARIETRSVHLRIKPQSLVELLDSVRHVFAVQARKKGIILEVTNTAGANDAFMGDGDRIRQVLVNLVGNAVKFTNHGRVTVEAELEGLDSDNGGLRCMVRDTGPGVPEEHRERIFEAFFQVDDSYARIHKGIGLGLAISKRLTDSMGGEISAENRPEGGAVFSFSVPVRAVPEQAVSSMCSRKEKGTNKDPLRVLIVEDDAVSGLASERMLAKLGHMPLLVPNGREALEALGKEKFDMVLMDVQLPGMDGLATLARIRASKAPYADIPVAALTACAMKGEQERFLAEGMTDYLAKPADIDELKRLLERLSANRH